MAIQENTVSAAPSAALRLVSSRSEVKRGPMATARQKNVAHQALMRLLAAGWTYSELSKRLGYSHQTLPRFRDSRTHLSATRCLDLVRFARDHAAPARQTAVAAVAPVAPVTAVAQPAVRAPAAPVATVTEAAPEAPARAPGANAESSPLNLRAPHDVIAQLTRVASKLPHGRFTQHKLAVLALEHGLAVIERDPMILLRGPASLSPTAPAPEAPTTPPLTLTTAQWDEIDGRVAAYRVALPGVPVSRADVVRGIVEAALAASLRKDA